MNHRYAFCSRDGDPDAAEEESPVTEPSTGTDAGVSALEDSGAYLSDSSIEEAPLEEDEEEENSLNKHLQEKSMMTGTKDTAGESEENPVKTEQNEDMPITNDTGTETE